MERHYLADLRSSSRRKDQRTVMCFAYTSQNYSEAEAIGVGGKVICLLS